MPVADSSASSPSGSDAAAADSAASSNDAAALKTRLAELDKELFAVQDEYRRCLAETENIRQTARRELARAQSAAMERFAREV
ncbi:hypothetical protein HK405_001106, partial [Cladochytrium tenue]